LIAWLIANFLVQIYWFLITYKQHLLGSNFSELFLVLRQIILFLSFLSRTSDAKICKVLKHGGQHDRSAEDQRTVPSGFVRK
jgi:hypothetical protein